jgi:uncharacterized protein (DUF2384 family)
MSHSTLEKTQLSTPDIKISANKLHKRLEQIIGDSENAKRWFNTPHPFLDGKTPQSLLDQGKFKTVDYIIYAIEVGQPL